MLSQHTRPNLIGDSGEEETFCVDTKRLSGVKRRTAELGDLLWML